MKNKFFNLYLMLPALLLVAGLWSCRKEESRIYLESANPVTLSASGGSSQVLTINNASKTAVTFSWNNPNYRFTTGMSSQDVNYTLQIDTTGANFSSPNKQEVSVSKALSLAYTVKDLNALLLKMGLAEDMSHPVEFRLKAAIGNSAPVYSNVVKINITPYLDVAVPVPSKGELWITGDAVESSWTNGVSNWPKQKFTRVSVSLYELTLDMPGGGAYKLLQENEWSTQYHMKSGGTWNAGEFERADADPAFPGPPTAGTYKITLNFKTGKYTVVKL